MRNEQRPENAAAHHRDIGADAVDQAIDRAVRDLMSVDADPSFTGRVLARAGQRTARRWSWGHGLGLAAAAGAAMVFAMVLWRPVATEPPPAAMVRDASPLLPPAPSVPPPTASDQTSAKAPTMPWLPPRPAGRDSTRPAARSAAVPGGAEDASDVAPAPIDTAQLRVETPPLARLDPIGIAPLTAAPIATAAIAIVPLEAIPAIGMAPLSPPVERD
jgi:hypothetical protein